MSLDARYFIKLFATWDLSRGYDLLVPANIFKMDMRLIWYACLSVSCRIFFKLRLCVFTCVRKKIRISTFYIQSMPPGERIC